MNIGYWALTVAADDDEDDEVFIQRAGCVLILRRPHLYCSTAVCEVKGFKYVYLPEFED